jgi:uncharacterized protein with von Willebrand factor type A (vWA) domain
VPAEPKFKYPRPAKPELMVVADISGSVAAFARFTLMLVYAIQGQFSKVRSFVFIDGIDEVTRFFDGVDDIADAVHRVNTEADVVWVDGHSDYGHALEVFWSKWGKEVGPKTTVLVLGDEAAGVVRGIGMFADRDSADAVNSDPEFASFNDAVTPLLAGPSERVELNLLHHYAK